MAFENWQAFVDKVKQDTESRKAAEQKKSDNNERGIKKHDDRYDSRNGKP